MYRFSKPNAQKAEKLVRINKALLGTRKLKKQHKVFQTEKGKASV